MRVIAGLYKGRALEGPRWAGLRPTSDKLRETLFNVLGASVQGTRVLDAYAGTGALGIEALSRGAAFVVFLERDPRALALIAGNLLRCGVSDGYAMIRAASGLRRRFGEGPAFDLILIDPPYDERDLGAAVAGISRWLAPAGLLVLEHGRRRPVPGEVADLALVRTVESGDSALAFFRHPPPSSRETDTARGTEPASPKSDADD